MKNPPLIAIMLSALFLVSCEKEKPEEEEGIDITGQTGTLTDIDGNTYNWIGIGEQAWMTENLKVTHYADGTAIPFVGSNSAWDDVGSDDKAYCWYEDLSSNKDIYGGLYSWAAAMNGTGPSDDPYPTNLQGACPDGWHLPTDQEWKNLEQFLGMSLQDANLDGVRGTGEGGKLRKAVPSIGSVLQGLPMRVVIRPCRVESVVLSATSPS